jgi:hypothetical protein
MNLSGEDKQDMNPSTLWTTFVRQELESELGTETSPPALCHPPSACHAVAVGDGGSSVICHQTA